MKKLNSKGFTLVELLAVIIILAVVVGITIPAIMSATNSAKIKAFQTAAQTSADWIERQYQLYLVGSSDFASDVTGNNGGLNASLKGKFSGTGLSNGQTGKNFTIAETETALIEATGLRTTNIKSIKVKINGERVCVLLEGKGDYAGVGTATATGADSATSNTNFSKGGACSGVSF